MRILVSSNCQTGGVAAALREILPQDDITALPLPALTREAETTFAKNLASADVWVSAGAWHLSEQPELQSRNAGLRLLKIPKIDFSAFHPDLCYARRRSDESYTPYHYNSAIGVWCYKNNIPVQDAARMFNASTFEGLGYFNAWPHCVAQLKAAFAATDLQNDFDRFLLHVKRQGLFMHSINHPRSATLVHLAKIAASHLGVDDGVYERDIMIDDGLKFDIWPVYPEIGDSLAIQGSGYRWRIAAETHIVGVADYLQYAYACYERENFSPEDIYVLQQNGRLDEVLAPQLGQRL